MKKIILFLSAISLFAFSASLFANCPAASTVHINPQGYWESTSTGVTWASDTKATSGKQVTGFIGASATFANGAIPRDPSTVYTNMGCDYQTDASQAISLEETHPSNPDVHLISGFLGQTIAICVSRNDTETCSFN